MSDERNFAVGDAEAPPRALQTSECNELLNPTRTSCVILVQRQPGKLLSVTEIVIQVYKPHLKGTCIYNIGTAHIHQPNRESLRKALVTIYRLRQHMS